ncbi:hypothetical protein NL676_027946 [Syzygium grande]|nr:hypothetical protein NL676_027946 [Syzygium grande]
MSRTNRAAAGASAAIRCAPDPGESRSTPHLSRRIANVADRRCPPPHHLSLCTASSVRTRKAARVVTWRHRAPATSGEPVRESGRRRRRRRRGMLVSFVVVFFSGPELV